MQRPTLFQIMICSTFMFVSTSFTYAQQTPERRIQLIKSHRSSTVYYLDPSSTRHAFPSQTVYESWYGNDFSHVVTLSEDYISSLPLGKNVSSKPGKYLVKIPSSPDVYAVEPDRTLRKITTEAVAKEVFGPEWFTRVREIPETSFSDYDLSNPIDERGDVPDGSVIREPGTGAQGANQNTYWYKWRGTLRPFASETVLRENGFTPTDALSTVISFTHRPQPFTARRTSLTEPGFASNARTFTCSLESTRMGLALVTNRSLTEPELELLSGISHEFPSFYHTVSRDLATITIAPEATVIELTPELAAITDRTTFLSEISRLYFEQNPDTVDYLAIFNTVYEQEKGLIALYTPVTNSIRGIGQVIMDRSQEFGSNGRLKGVIDMQRIEQYLDTSGNTHFLFDTLAHEIVHSASGLMEFELPNNGGTSDALLAYKDPAHWSPYLMKDSIIGGFGWVKQDSGNFISHANLDADFQRGFHDLDLYAFGLLPASRIPPIEYIDVADKAAKAPATSGEVKQVSMDQILYLLGKRECIRNGF